MKTVRHLNQIRERRTKRVRAKIFGNKKVPRLAVFRSNVSVYAQLIDDGEGKTLASASSRELVKEMQKKSKTEKARAVGELIAKKARTLGIGRVLFDRRSYAYHGRVKAVAEGARHGGLKI